MEKHFQLNAVIVEAPEGGFTGYFVEFPEAVAEGETQQELEENLVETLKFVLEYKKESNSNEYKNVFDVKTKPFNFEFA